MRRWIIFGVVAVMLLLLATPLVAIYYAAFTEDGLAFIVSHIPKRIARTDLTIKGARGTLARGLHIDLVELQHEVVHLKFEDINGRIELAPLLLQTLRSPQLTIHKVLVEAKRRQTPLVPSEPRFLPHALKIRADAVSIDAATLVLISGRRFEFAGIKTSGVAQHKLIRFFQLEGNWDVWRVEGDGRLHAADPLGMEGALRLNWRVPGQPAWVIASTLDGNLDELSLTAQVTAPIRADFKGQLLDLTSRWHWQGKTQVQDLDIRTWGGSGALGRITGELNVRGDADGFGGQGPLTPAALEVGAFDTVFEGSYADRTLTATRIEVTHQSSHASITGRGTIAVVPNGPELNLDGAWRDFRWPLVGRLAAVNSASGDYALKGVWPFELHSTGSIKVPALPKALPFEMSGQLDKSQLVVNKGRVKIFDGESNVAGKIAWAPQISWSISGDATDINPAQIRPDLPGKVSFAFEASGEGPGIDRDFRIRVQHLDGMMRNMAASGTGTISRRGSVWSFQSIRAELGRTELVLDGSINGQFNLKFGIETTDLGLLDTDARGRLRAQGTLRGTLEEPVINATANGSLLRHKNIALGSLDAVVDFDPHSTEKSTIDVRGRDFAFGQRKIDQLQFSLDGTAAEHVLHMNLSGPGLKVQSRAQGSFIKGIWQGTLAGLDVNGSESLHLELESPVAMMLSGAAMRLERLCLHGSPARLCADAEWSTQQWAVNILANDLPMSTLTTGLTPGVDYKGVLSISAQAFASGSEPVQGNLRADLKDAQLAHQLASGRAETITLGSGMVKANMTTESITANLSLDAGEIGTIKGQISAARSSDNLRELPLSGELHAQTGELGFVSIYMPQIDRASGRLSTDLEISGWIGEPLVNGVVRLTDGELDLYQINLALRGVGIEARLTDNGLDFGGSARVGDGTAQVQGRFTWRNAMPYGQFKLKGENLRVANIPEAKISASPNLDFRIDGHRIAVSGGVTVPRARIVPADLTNAVRASSDEIIVGEVASPTDRSEVLSNITLTLGDRVDIDTSGLKGRLTGNITVRSGYEEITRATGELNIEDGEYTAYGRRLDIDRGRLIFSGGPVANPGIDIRAEKKFPDVVAGMNVRGTLLQPRMTFFSEPSLPQSQIVQLILAGGSIQYERNKSNNAAGNELLAQGGAILAQQIGSKVGIEDVGIESTLANETSIVLGKYLSPRLYVSYGISLTESLNTLKLRYTLGDHWTIKTEYGEEGGADLVYTIDK